jgi:protein-S-isoprenylcysteine O-methyltransferase Ste14
VSADGAATPAARAFAWTGAALFAAALGYFLFTYAVTFGEIIPPPADWRDVAVDVALFSIFAVHHSVFARAPIRNWIARKISGQLERSTYVWVASLMLILVCALWRPIAGVGWEVRGAGVWLLRLAMLTGIWLSLRSAAIIDMWELAGTRQIRATPARPGVGNREFRVEGPYAWVRHPIYLGWFLVVFSVTPMTMTRLLFAVVSCVYVLIAIPLEERSLRATAGEPYARYARLVRWKLLPGVY